GAVHPRPTYTGRPAQSRVMWGGGRGPTDRHITCVWGNPCSRRTAGPEPKRRRKIVVSCARTSLASKSSNVIALVIASRRLGGYDTASFPAHSRASGNPRLRVPGSEAKPGTPRPHLRPFDPRNRVPPTGASRGAPRGDERRGMARGAKVRARRLFFGLEHLEHLEAVGRLEVLVHHRMDGADHRVGRVRLEDVAAHVHASGALLDGVVSHG